MLRKRLCMFVWGGGGTRRAKGSKYIFFLPYDVKYMKKRFHLLDYFFCANTACHVKKREIRMFQRQTFVRTRIRMFATRPWFETSFEQGNMETRFANLNKKVGTRNKHMLLLRYIGNWRGRRLFQFHWAPQYLQRGGKRWICPCDISKWMFDVFPRNHAKVPFCSIPVWASCK